MIQSWRKRNCTVLPSFLYLMAVTMLTICHGADVVSQGLNQDDITYIRKQAAIGDPEAQFSLALMLEHGDGVQQDKQEAVTWFTRAAEKNLAGACLYLALKYEYGSSVDQDLTKAAYWYRKAAFQGWPSAQYFLGMLYLLKKDIPENKVKAFTWLSISAGHDYPDAEEEKNKILPLLSDKERKEAEKTTEDYTNAILNGENIE